MPAAFMCSRTTASKFWEKKKAISSSNGIYWRCLFFCLALTIFLKLQRKIKKKKIWLKFLNSSKTDVTNPYIINSIQINLQSCGFKFAKYVNSNNSKIKYSRISRDLHYIYMNEICECKGRIECIFQSNLILLLY